MKDKYGKEIKIGYLVKTIDALGVGRVVEIDEENDRIVTEYKDGKRLKSSKGIERYGFAVVVGRPK